MRKAASERAVRSLCHDWLQIQPISERVHPSFLGFRAWLDEHYPQVLSFRSVRGPTEDAERWFDEELGQTWRR
jgi:hypothetical protein